MTDRLNTGSEGKRGGEDRSGSGSDGTKGPDVEPEVRTLNIGDAEIQFLYYPGDGPTMMLLHATGFLHWLWHPIARSLAGAFEVIAPGLWSHRNVPPEDGGLRWQVLCEDVLALSDGLGVRRPFLVGHSMGGTVATLAAAARSGWARRLVLIEPIFLPEEVYRGRMDVDHHPLASKSIRRRNHWSDAEEAEAYLRRKPLFRDWDAEMIDLYIRCGMVPAQDGGLTLACSPRREASLFMGGVHTDPWPLMGKVDCPVLVVEGEKSDNRGHIDLKKAAEVFPRGRFLQIPRAGHLIPMERPRETTRVIREFLCAESDTP